MQIKNLKKRHSFFIFIIYTRYLIGSAYIFASIIKIKGKRFTTVSGENEPFNTAFHFFETLYQSGIYWKFIGVAQLLAGVLLVTQRYAKLGALICLPISLNIFMITISYNFGYTHVITGLYLIANIALIAWDWPQLKVILNYEPIPLNTKTLSDLKIFQVTGLILALYTIIYRVMVDRYNILQWMIICTTIGLSGFLYYLKSKKNSQKKS
ncbi:hypothetical protein [Flavobacterium sp. TBRC 19031]|uniref:hypothetical protein n=1 Tax=Flavobacterium mekongense TaxID=3379707 RepID=UPI00399C179A